MNYLLNVVNTYRVPTEEAALRLREELNSLDCGELIGFSYTIKELKSKGEVYDTYYLVKAKIRFTDEKDPEANVTVQYN